MKIYKIIKFLVNHPIGRRRKRKVIFRFFSWQILSKLKIAKKVFMFVEGTKLNIQRGQTVSTGNYYVGLMEFEEMAFAIHFLDRSDIFFDIGANIGSYSILASGISHSKSIAFEPINSTFLQLEKNISLNHLHKRIIPFNIGLAEKQNMLTFSTTQDAKNHVVGKNEILGKTKKIEVKTLDDFVEYQPNLIKIDVEGYEEFILKGGKSILANEKLNAIIIEVNEEGTRYNIENNSIHKILRSNNFKLYSYNPFKRELNEVEYTTNKDNRIYIRDFNRVLNKIKSSPKFNVFGVGI